MFKFRVPENDQTVYELKTKSGKSYFVRCPGQRFTDHEGNPRIGIPAFLVNNGKESTVMLHNLDKIVSITPRPDLPIGDIRPRFVEDLMWVSPGKGCYSFPTVHLE